MHVLGRVDEDKIIIGCISNVHAQVILLGVIGIHAKNTFHFVGRIQLISNHVAILTNNESCTFNRKILFRFARIHSARIQHHFQKSRYFKIHKVDNRDSRSALKLERATIRSYKINLKYSSDKSCLEFICTL